MNNKNTFKLDHRDAADVRRRQMGDISSCRDGLRQLFATGNPWRLDAYIRDRTVRDSVRMFFTSSYCEVSVRIFFGN